MFQIRVRSLKGDTYAVECQQSDTIAKVKSIIEGLKGHPAAHQKLIYNGNILVGSGVSLSRSLRHAFFFLFFFFRPFCDWSRARGASRWRGRAIGVQRLAEGVWRALAAGRADFSHKAL